MTSDDQFFLKRGSKASAVTFKPAFRISAAISMNSFYHVVTLKMSDLS
jgi:hypothetical protein